jgi:hypothetical protein
VAGALDPSLFTADSWANLLAALAGAQDALDNDGASQEDVDLARGVLLAAIHDLAVQPRYSALEGLIGLLLSVADYDPALYTAESWAALDQATGAAWAFVAEDAATDGAGLAPRADVAAGILYHTVAVKEALANLVPKAGGAAAKATLGVVAAQAQSDHLIEAGAAPEPFSVIGYGIKDVGAINLRLSFKDDGATLAYTLDGTALEGIARIVSVTEDVPAAAAGYKTVSVYILAGAVEGAGGAPFTTADGAAVLNVEVTPGEAKTAVVQLLMSHAAVACYDAAIGGVEVGIDADVTIHPAAAATLASYWTKYDVNRDGKVTLADVNAVRQYLGSAASGGAWSPAAAGWADITQDGAVDFADLTLVIAKYESVVG